jgi:two-component system NtrC family response regulator
MEKQKNILLVDDDKSILRILTRILQKQGYSVRTAETGREAEEMINSQSFDLALIDVKLPDTDGLDLLQKIQVTKPSMVKIILTGFASMDNGIKALNSGAGAYLVKPVEPTELLKVLKEKFEEQSRTKIKS